VVHEPGPGIMYVRFAVTNLYLKKKKRGLLSYTPMGFVVHSTMQAAVRDLWKKSISWNSAWRWSIPIL